MKPIQPEQIKQLLLARRVIGKRGCWIWPGKGDHSYGMLHLPDGKIRSVHRLSYEAWVGVIPKGQVILHICDVRRCFNPHHLIAGTQRQNMLDCVKKGRHRPRGIGESLIKDSTPRVSVSTSIQVIERLQKILKTGFFGDSLSSCAERLICEQIRFIENDGIFLRKSRQKLFT